MPTTTEQTLSQVDAALAAYHAAVKVRDDAKRESDIIDAATSPYRQTPAGTVTPSLGERLRAQAGKDAAVKRLAIAEADVADAEARYQAARDVERSRVEEVLLKKLRPKVARLADAFREAERANTEVAKIDAELTALLGVHDICAWPELGSDGPTYTPKLVSWREQMKARGLL